MKRRMTRVERRTVALLIATLGLMGVLILQVVYALLVINGDI
jgi:hypothetical protein